MWPFRKKKKQSIVRRTMGKVVVGMIIGGAIGSIVGKTLMEEHEKEKEGLIPEKVKKEREEKVTVE